MTNNKEKYDMFYCKNLNKNYFCKIYLFNCFNCTTLKQVFISDENNQNQYNSNTATYEFSSLSSGTEYNVSVFAKGSNHVSPIKKAYTC